MTRWTRALVTGASSGIGDAIARRLAADGTDLVIVARDESRLLALAAELADRDIEVLVADLGDEAQLAKVEARLADEAMPIDLLVNNAGFGHQGRFVELDLDAEVSVIDVNITAVVRLAHAAGRAMAARGDGGILNVASIAGLAPSPGSAIYGASKAFVVSFGEALHQELADSGVVVSTVCPGFTRTEFQSRADYDASIIPWMLWQSPDRVAGSALAGLAKGSPRVVPGVHNKAAAGATKLLPAFVNRRVAGLLSDG